MVAQYQNQIGVFCGFIKAYKVRVFYVRVMDGYLIVVAQSGNDVIGRAFPVVTGISLIGNS